MYGITTENTGTIVNLNVNIKNTNLKEGQIVKARIINLDGNKVQLQIKNSIIDAGISGAVELYEGQQIELCVKHIDMEGFLIFELLESQQLGEDAVKNLLNKAGINKDIHNIKALLLLLNYQLPVSKKNIEIIKNLMNRWKYQRMIYSKDGETSKAGQDFYYESHMEDGFKWVFCTPVVFNGHQSKLGMIKLDQPDRKSNYAENKEKFVLFIDTKNLGLLMIEIAKQREHINLNIKVEQKEVLEFMHKYKSLFENSLKLDNFQVNISFEEHVMDDTIQNINVPEVDIKI